MKDVLTVPEAAKEAGLTRAGVWQAIRDKRLKATQVGRDWLIQRRDWAAYMKSRPRARKGRP